MFRRFSTRDVSNRRTLLSLQYLFLPVAKRTMIGRKVYTQNHNSLYSRLLLFLPSDTIQDELRQFYAQARSDKIATNFYRVPREVIKRASQRGGLCVG